MRRFLRSPKSWRESPDSPRNATLGISDSDEAIRSEDTTLPGDLLQVFQHFSPKFNQKKLLSWKIYFIATMKPKRNTMFLIIALLTPNEFVIRSWSS
jgi:hypothetical protein